MRTLNKPSRQYSTIRQDLDTFDIVLWSGEELLSRFIQYGTGSTWSHVGMVIRMPGDLIMLWESTIGDDHSGVQLTPLHQWICGTVAVRRMRVQRTQALWDRLMQVRKELDGRPYESSWVEFIRAGYDGPLGANTRDITTLFCAELVAETLQQVGLLAPDIPSNEFTPKDFSTEANQPLKLLMGAVLEDEILLEPDPMKSTLKKEVKINTRGLVSQVFYTPGR